MTNKQLAGARAAFRQFPDLRPRKEGDAITPYRVDNPSTVGASVTVTESMSASEVEHLLVQSCAAIDG